MNKFDGLYLLLRVERKSLKEKVEDSCSWWATEEEFDVVLLDLDLGSATGLER